MSSPIQRLALSSGGGDAPGLNAVIRAATLAGRARSHSSSSNRAVIFILVGLLSCLLPGLFLFIAKIMNDGFERRVMGKVGAEVKTRYPEAAVTE